MQIQLSISILVSDRGESVGRCLDSLVPVLQNIPSELIVVYTGTNGESLETVKKYTENMITFQWCDDFSAARNAGLERAIGEWFMFIDDDEWLDDPAEIIDFFSSGEYKKYNSANYLVRNYADYRGESYCDTWVSRLSKRCKGLQFEGIVHEGLHPWKAPTKNLKCFAHHYGYAKDVSEKGKRGGRNIPLLKKQLNQEPHNIRYHVQLAQEYWATGDYMNAEKLCRDTLKLKAEGENRYLKSWASVMLVNSLSSQGKKADAYQEGIQILESYSLGELYEMNVCITLMPVCVQLKKYSEGVGFARKFINFKDMVMNTPDIWEKQERLSFSSAYTLTGSYQVLSNALHCAALGRDSRSFGCFLNHVLDTKIIETADLYTIIEQLKNEDVECEALVLGCFKEIESEGSYENLQKALYYEKLCQFDKAEEFYCKSVANAEAFYAHHLIAMALRNSYQIPDFIEALDLENWKKCSQLVSEIYTASQYFEEKQKFNWLFEEHPIYKLVLWQKLSAKCLYDEQMPLNIFERVLSDYCSTVISLNRYLYKDELFDGYLTLCLPKDCRAALRIQEVLDNLVFPIDTNVSGKLKRLMREFPQLNFVIKRFIDYIDLESAKIKKGAVDEEFCQTSDAVKSVMKSLADKEQYLEALSIAEELGKLLPDDEEVKRYRQMLKKVVNESLM